MAFLQTALVALLIGPLIGGSVSAERTRVSQHCLASNSSETIYQFSEKELNVPRSIRFSKYTGKVSLLFVLLFFDALLQTIHHLQVVLVVNVATF